MKLLKGRTGWTALVLLSVCPLALHADTLTLSQAALMASQSNCLPNCTELGRSVSGGGVEFWYSLPGGTGGTFEWQDFTPPVDLYLFAPYLIGSAFTSNDAVTDPYPYRMVGVGFITYPMTYLTDGWHDGWSGDAEIRVLVEPIPGARQLNSSAEIPTGFPLSAADEVGLRFTLVSATVAGRALASNEELGIGTITALRDASVPEPFTGGVLGLCLAAIGFRVLRQKRP